MKTPVSSMLLVIAASFIGSFGAVFLKLGAGKLQHGLRHLISVRLASGIALFVASSVQFLIALKHGELSVLYPMVSFSYILTLFWSKIFSASPLREGRSERSA